MYKHILLNKLKGYFGTLLDVCLNLCLLAYFNSNNLCKAVTVSRGLELQRLQFVPQHLHRVCTK